MQQRARILAVVNQKGGVGKTTTAVNLAVGLAQRGEPTLLVDSDPQANATSGLGVDSRASPINLFVLIQEVISGRPVPQITSGTVATGRPNLHLIPATIDLAGADIVLASQIARETILQRILSPLRDHYMWIIVDTPPSLGILTVNALSAAEGLIVPVQCEYYALEGLTRLLQTVELVKRHLNPALEIWKVLLTMHDARTRLSEQVEGEVRKFFGARVARAVIPRSVRVSEAPSFGQSVIEYDARSRAAAAYAEFVEEVRAYASSCTR